jgi:hypothetical protein
MQKKSSRAADLIGQRFGKVVVTEKVGVSKYRTVLWRCRCDCGGSIVAQTSDLRRGKVQSCGCNHFKDRQTIGGKPTRLYRIWKNMKKRCLNQNNPDYLYYGARGITVCNEWLEFAPFQEWALSHGYSEDLTIDRVDNNGNYEPSNCKWATRKEQAQHRRPNGTVIKNGVPCISEGTCDSWEVRECT